MCVCVCVCVCVFLRCELIQLTRVMQLGGILVELAEQDRLREYRFAFVCANLGNWKAFVFAAEHGEGFVEVTGDNRRPRCAPYRCVCGLCVYVHLCLCLSSLHIALQKICCMLDKFASAVHM